MFCPYCGKPTADGSAFCANCGGSLRDVLPPVSDPVTEEAPITEPAAAEPAAETVQAFDESAPTEEIEPDDEFIPIEEPAPAEDPEPVQQYAPPAQEPVAQQPIYYATPVAAPVAAPVVRTRPKSSIVAKIFSVLLCIILVVDVFGILACLSLRKSISANAIKNALEEIDILEFPYDNENTVLEMIEEQYKETGEDISAEEIREALDESKAYSELKNIAVDFVGYVLGDSGSQLPDADNLRDLVEDLCDDLDYEMTDADLAELDVMLEDFEDAMDEFKDSTLEDVPELAEVEAVLSTLVIGVLGAVAALIVLLILLMNRRRYATFSYMGVSTLIAGGMCYAVGALSDMVIKAMGENDASAEYILDAFGGMFTGSFARVGLIGAGVGAALIIVYIICSAISKKKYRV